MYKRNVLLIAVMMMAATDAGGSAPKAEKKTPLQVYMVFEGPDSRSIGSFEVSKNGTIDTTGHHSLEGKKAVVTVEEFLKRVRANDYHFTIASK